VARACDTCRRRKVKCDGKQPCIHCTVYSYECTYNQTRPAPAKKQKKSESASSAAQDVKIEHEESTVPLTTSAAPKHITTPTSTPPSSTSNSNLNSNANMSDQLIQAMFPQLDVNHEGFNRDLFLQVLEKNRKNGMIDLNSILKEYHSLENPNVNHSIAPIEIKIILPPREIALKLIYKTWNDSCVLFRFYHRPSFINDFNSLYETSPAEYSNHQNKVLPLIYSVIAVGALFSKGDNAIDNQYLQDEGYKYFIASRKLIDITNSTDIQSIQTIFMLTLFLQCSARLSTCYSYIGIALRSALRQGLHRKLQNFSNPIESEVRKRLFWTIYKLEIYVNSMLGLPNSIDESDIDVELPLNLDDVNIDAVKIVPQAPGKLSSCGINNSHTKLILVLNHIVKKLYKTSNPVFVIPIDTIKNLENELKVWLYELPDELKPNNEVPREYLKANTVLHLDYLHVQIMLYRPFIHYVKIAQETGVSNSSYQLEKGWKCIEISKQIVYLAQQLIHQKLLNGSYWFSIYTIFFAVACLVYYFLEVDKTNKEINHTIEMGKQILSVLKQRSVSAERIYNLLNSMFENYDRNNIRLQVLEHTENVIKPDPVTQQLQSHDMGSIDSSIAIAPSGPPLEQSQYVPGMMDDFDLKIFGRFLPSYMLQRPQGTEGPGENGGDMPNSESLDGISRANVVPAVSTQPMIGGDVNLRDDDEDEGIFDWDRFFDKNDENLNLEI